MVSDFFKIVFIHIPKTGGTSIEKVFWPLSFMKSEKNLFGGFINDYENKYQTGGLQHLKWYQIFQEIGDRKFNDYYKFSIVRNPYDKAVSQYEYLKKRNDLLHYINAKSDLTFLEYCEKINSFSHVQWEPQHNFVFDKATDEFKANRIIKLEDINTDFQELRKDVVSRNKLYGIFVPNKLPHLNKSRRKNFKKYYCSKTYDLITTKYSKDLKLLDYQFD